MPSLVEIVDHEHSPPERAVPDVLAAFERAKRQPLRETPDLMAAFERAAAASRKGNKEQRECEEVEKAKPFISPSQRENKDNDRER